MSDLYALLGVPRDADKATIRKAYRRAAKKAHPDGGGSPEKFRLVSQALEVLIDPLRRRTYDETGTIEDKPVDNAESELMGLISALLDHVLQSCEQNGVPWESADLIAMMIKRAEAMEREHHANRQKIKEAIPRFKRLEKRFRKKKKDAAPNRMESLIAGRIAFFEGQDAMLMRQIESMRKAAAALKDYDFDFDKLKPNQMMQAAMGGQAFTVRFG